MSAAPSETVQTAARPGASVSRAWLRALELTAPIPRQRERVLPAVVDELGHRLGNKPALLSDRECFTYLELAGRARRYARWALAQGVAKGDVVGLLMPNRPEYLAIWLGVTRAAAGVGSRRTARHRRADRKPRGRATRSRGVVRDHHRRPRALHLHVGHHG